jgi:hypothetical protein
MYQPYPGETRMPEPSRSPVPPSVINAARVMYAGAAASLIGIIIDLTTLSATKSTIEKRRPGLTPSQVTAAEHVAIVEFIVAGLIGAALWIFIAQTCKAGKGWGRIVATVLFGIDTLAQLFTAGSSGGGARIFALLVWLIGLAAIVLLWRRQSSEYFRGQQPGAGI